jgi:hypothetical protein
MKFDGRLRGLETRPGKQAEAKVDGGGIQGVYCGAQFRPQGFVCVKSSRSNEQALGEVRVDPPVSDAVGVRQCGSSDRGAEPNG